MTHWRSATRYRIMEALRDVSFEVSAGEFIGIIGHNGSGKSTLLKILSRIYRPDAGVVAVEGKVSPFLELGVGFNPELTARENIFLSGAILGLGRAELHRLFDEIIGFAELEQFVDHKLKNFSSGMEVRLAFSLAIQAHAEILMMDEVLAVGDASFQQKCFDIFARYKREGRTVVLVTHELGAVMTYCDRALLLDHGRRDDGLMVSEASLPVSQYAQVGDSQREAGGTIRFDIPQLPLLDGAYSIDIEIQGRRDGAIYDHLKHAVHFRVIDKRARRGVVEAGGVWSVVAGEQPPDTWQDPLG